ncbi:MAG: 1-acyl-sn-glycerol-3-phosphate acyltransferase [Acidimicrobiales bacterium]|nr:1-acyl-sn-glycerol-3-phosphate acyltransferase [Acidimicrobiales bacterium]
MNLRWVVRKPPVPLGVDPLPQRSRTGVNFPTDWAHRPLAKTVRAGFVEGVMRPVVSTLALPTRRGLDRLDILDVDQPVIFAANHHSHIDTPLLLTSIPRPWRRELVPMAAADYFFGNSLSGAIAALSLGAVPMERNKVNRTSADKAVELIEAGHSLVIFPEGGRSPDGWGRQFRRGAAYLALRADVPVVPVHIEGTSRILPKGRSRPKAAPTTVTFGYPLTPTDGERSQDLSNRIEAAVAQMSDEVSSDWYQARRRAHAGETPSLAGPRVGAWRRIWALESGPKRRSRRAWPKV